MPLSLSKHKELIMEGVLKPEEVNLEMDVGILPFIVVGDVETLHPKSF